MFAFLLDRVAVLDSHAFRNSRALQAALAMDMQHHVCMPNMRVDLCRSMATKPKQAYKIMAADRHAKRAVVWRAVHIAA